MQFTKHLVVAAALASMGFANAAGVVIGVGQTRTLTDDARGAASTGRQVNISVLSGGGGLYFSNGTTDPTIAPPANLTSVGGLVGALNVGQVVLTPVDDAVLSQENRLAGKNSKSTRAVVNVTASVTSLTADFGSGQISTVNTRGGVTETSPYIDFVLDGGQITTSNLTIDLVNKTVSADLNGRPLLADGVSYGAPVSFNGALWSIGEIVGPTSLPPDAVLAAQDGDTTALEALGYQIVSRDAGGTVTLKALNQLKNLKVTDAAFATFAEALGLAEGGTGYTALNDVNTGANGWGTLQSEIVFAIAGQVPEPGSYALFGLGLMGILVASRRTHLRAGARQ